MSSADDSHRFREADLQFAVPKVPKTKERKALVRVGDRSLVTAKETRKVLPEEMYLENMKSIIVRDYFPDVKKLKIQKEYLDAMTEGDEAKMRELRVKYGLRSAPGATPSLSDIGTPSTQYGMTPDHFGFPNCNIEGDNDRLEPVRVKRPSKMDKFTVQSYVDRYTSEDNASFEELAAVMRRREEEKNAWMYAAEKKHNEAIEAKQSLAVAPADEQLVAVANGSEKALTLDNWTYRARNTVLFNPTEDAPLTSEEIKDRMVQGQVTINPAATRLSKDALQKAHASTMARAAIHQAANKLGQVDVTGEKLDVVGMETLGCVSTPLIRPGIEDTPVMTWGEIDGTPFRLDGDPDDAGPADAPAFRIPSPPLRDRIADSIAEKISNRYGQKRKVATKAVLNAYKKTPSFGTQRTNCKVEMSPAARNLMVNKFGIKLGGMISKPSSNADSPFSARSRASSSSSIRSMVRRTPRRPPAGDMTPDVGHGSASSAVVGLLKLQPSLPE